MEKHGQFCLDFFDTSTQKAVDTPEGLDIWHAGKPGTHTFGGKLVSWQDAFRLDPGSRTPGYEKFSAPEGAYLALLKDGKETLFYFQLPTRAFSHGFPFVHGVRPT